MEFNVKIHCEINIKLVFHEILGKKNFTGYPSLNGIWHFIKTLYKQKVKTFFLNTLIALNTKWAPRFNDPPSSHFESVFNLFLFRCELEFVLVWIVQKKLFFRPDFVDFEIVVWGMTSLIDFYKRVQILLKKNPASMCQIAKRKCLLFK